MAAATIRLGKISSINYTAGKARVVYEDRDDSVTSELPFLALQYNIPKVDDLVVVACFSNGTVSGVILGPVYNSANTPHEGSRTLMITRPGYPTCRMTQPRQKESRPCRRSWTHWKKE